MIDYHRFCQIKDLHEHQGLNASQIAKALTRDPRTVSYWLAQEHFRPRRPSQRHSKLDPFKQETLIGSRALVVYVDVDGPSAANNRPWLRK